MGCGACANKKAAAAVLPTVHTVKQHIAPDLVTELKAQWTPSEYQKLSLEWAKIRATTSIAAFAQEKKSDFRDKVLRGVPAEERWDIWKAALAVNGNFTTEYDQCLAQTIPASVLHDIKKDLDRTFPEFEYFRGAGQTKLSNVLKALAAADPEVAYCQGLNCVIAMLLLASNGDEAGTFAVYRGASRLFGWHGLYIQEFPKMWEMTYQWQALLKAKDRELYKALKTAGVQEALWLTKGLLTVYSALLPMSLAIRVWDVLLVDGEDVIFKTALTIMWTLRPELQGLDLAAIATLLRDLPRRNFPANHFIAAMLKEPVPHDLLAAGSAKYKDKQRQISSVVS